MNFNFEETFKIPIRAMEINRSHPNIKRDKKWFIHFIFHFSIFTAVFLLCVYNVTDSFQAEDLDLICKNGVLSMLYFVVSFQYLIMLWKQDHLLNLMTLMKNDYVQAKSLSFDEQKIMYKYVKKEEYVCNQWLILSTCSCGIFLVKSLVLILYQYIIGEPKLIQFYDFVYPEIIEKRKDNILVFLVIYVTIFYYGLYAVCMYLAFIPFGLVFMLHLCGELEIVVKKIECIFEDGGKEAEEKLKEIVKKLQCIYRFLDEVLVSYRVSYEFILKATAISLPILCYEVIEAFHHGIVSLEFITFIGGSIFISSSPCYYSDLLMEKGETVRIALYSSGWESFNDNKIRSTIRIMQIRALRPIAIRTLFRTMCLEALTDLFQQSYTIFNLINCMWS